MDKEQQPLEMYSVWRHREHHYQVQVIAWATVNGMRTVTITRIDPRGRAVGTETILVATLRRDYFLEIAPSELEIDMGGDSEKQGAA